MELHQFRTMWGIEEPWDAVLPQLPETGFVGIEAPLPFLQERDPDLVPRHGLRCIPMIFTEGPTVDDHVASFRAQAEAALAYDPVLINCHDGVDAWSEAEARRYFDEVLAVEADLGVAVAHETHRGRVLYNPWIAARLLDRFDALQLCCDYSHWVCVCERLIDDQQAVLQQCARHALHVHARVGYEEGPQVPDPRAAEYRSHVDAHERWWDLIWDAHEARGRTATTMTPEFGPPPYLQTRPGTSEPLADLADVCLWQARRQARRFAERLPRASA